jgi:glucokinase
VYLNEILSKNQMKAIDRNVIIGVDVGGTKIQAGAIDKEGTIICEPVTTETIGEDKSENIFNRITGSIESVIRKSGLLSKDIVGIGMGVTGPLDTQAGTILECPQLPTMHFFPLRARVSELFRLPVIMDNDANALILGESVWGAGKGHRTTLGFTLGTGLGCAIVSDRRLFTGTNGMAGEIWPSPYKEETIEDIVSGRGVSAIYHRLTNQTKTAKEISLLAQDGDRNAIEAWNVFGDALGFAVAWGINLIDPGIVILGGSIANSYSLFHDSMDKIVRKTVCPVPAAKTRIVKAALGDNAGFIGSAALVLQGEPTNEN